MRAKKKDTLPAWDEADTGEYQPIGVALRADASAQGRTRASSAIVPRMELAEQTNPYASYAEQVRQQAHEDEEQDDAAVWQRLRTQAERSPPISAMAPAGTYARWEQGVSSGHDYGQALDAQPYEDDPLAEHRSAGYLQHGAQPIRAVFDEGGRTKQRGMKLLALALGVLLGAGGAFAYKSRPAAPIRVASPVVATSSVAGPAASPVGKQETRAPEALLDTQAVLREEAQLSPVVSAVQPEPAASESDAARASERAERRAARRAARQAEAAKRREDEASSTERGGPSDVVNRADDPLDGI